LGELFFTFTTRHHARALYTMPGRFRALPLVSRLVCVARLPPASFIRLALPPAPQDLCFNVPGHRHFLFLLIDS
jgi:hypothetical protein